MQRTRSKRRCNALARKGDATHSLKTREGEGPRGAREKALLAGKEGIVSIPIRRLDTRRQPAADGYLPPRGIFRLSPGRGGRWCGSLLIAVPGSGSGCDDLSPGLRPWLWRSGLSRQQCGSSCLIRGAFERAAARLVVLDQGRL